MNLPERFAWIEKHALICFTMDRMNLTAKHFLQLETNLGLVPNIIAISWCSQLTGPCMGEVARILSYPAGMFFILLSVLLKVCKAAPTAFFSQE